MEELLDRRFVTMIEDVFLGRAGVAVTEWALWVLVDLRVAGRPAIGTQVANVKEVTGADGAHGIAGVAGANIGVSLAFDVHDIARSEFRFARQQPEKAA